MKRIEISYTFNAYIAKKRRHLRLFVNDTSKDLYLACSSVYAPMRSSADAGTGVNELQKAPTSSMNLAIGIFRSFSPSVMSRRLISGKPYSLVSCLLSPSVDTRGWLLIALMLKPPSQSVSLFKS